MAVIKHSAIKNASYSDGFQYLTFKHDEFTNKPILDENGRMIPRDDYIIEGINCTPESYGLECRAVNDHFGKNQSRSEIKAHHYIISFDPRDKEENGLTMESAQALGMEFARRNFPGHQVMVCTHPDGHHSAGNIHVHIVLNSVRAFDVERQPFMERPCDALAGNKHHVTKGFLEYLKQETMSMCQRESLYQVDLLSPAKVRITDREYWAQMKGQIALARENEEKIENGITPEKTVFETDNAFLRRVILLSLEDSSDYEEFQKKLFEKYGIAVHESRGRISYQLPDRSRPIRGRKLGTDFEKEHILDVLLQKQDHRYHSDIRGVVDPETNEKAQKNKNYARKVKAGNLQQMSRAVAYLQENNLESLDELNGLISAISADVSSKNEALKKTSRELTRVNALIRNTGQYLANKKVYGAYLKAKNKQQFRNSHESELLLYEAARKELRELTGSKKIPALKQLKAQKKMLVAKKNEQYEAFSFSRARLRELQAVNKNVRELLNDSTRKKHIPAQTK